MVWCKAIIFAKPVRQNNRSLPKDSNPIVIECIIPMDSTPSIKAHTKIKALIIFCEVLKIYSKVKKH